MRRLPLILVVVAALALTGCSDDEGTPQPSPGALGTSASGAGTSTGSIPEGPTGAAGTSPAAPAASASATSATPSPGTAPGAPSAAQGASGSPASGQGASPGAAPRSGQPSPTAATNAPAGTARPGGGIPQPRRWPGNGTSLASPAQADALPDVDPAFRAALRQQLADSAPGCVQTVRLTLYRADGWARGAIADCRGERAVLWERAGGAWSVAPYFNEDAPPVCEDLAEHRVPDVMLPEDMCTTRAGQLATYQGVA